MRYLFLCFLLLASPAAQAARARNAGVKALPDGPVTVKTSPDQPLTVQIAKDQPVTVKLDSSNPIKLAKDDGLLTPTTLIAVLSLIVSGISLYMVFQSSQDQAHSFQLSLADSAYKNVRDSQGRYNDAKPEDATDAANLLMRDLEYLALLINSGDLNDKNVVRHFSKQLKAWHDQFLPHFGDWFTDPERLPELKKLVSTL